MSHDFPMIFPLKWPFWSRTSQPWAHPGRRLPPRPLSHQLLLQWLCNRQNFARYLCMDANAICVFYVFRIRMFLFFLSLSISRFSFKLLNFEYISHQWWVFHESVKRWYKSIQICISHSFICRYGSTLSMFLKLSSTRYFSIFAAVLAWLFAPLKRSGPLCRVISNSPHGWSENHRGIGPGTTGATILSRSVKTVFIARISGIHFSSNPYYIDFHR
jgi:hypothetical protein